MKSLHSSTLVFAFIACIAGCCGSAQQHKGEIPKGMVGTVATTRPAESTGVSLFDGKTFGHWKPIDYAGAGVPEIENGSIILPVGERLTGITWTGDVPKMNYEMSFDAKRVDGTDFFAGLTFPVADSFASLIVGGWGGTVCGISSIDDEDAAHNPTRSFQRFENNKWYHIRLRVTPTKIESWIDGDKIIDVVTTGKKLSLRLDIEESKPLGLASFQCTAAIRDIRLKSLDK